MFKPSLEVKKSRLREAYSRKTYNHPLLFPNNLHPFICSSDNYSIKHNATVINSAHLDSPDTHTPGVSLLPLSVSYVLL